MLILGRRNDSALSLSPKQQRGTSLTWSAFSLTSIVHAETFDSSNAEEAEMAGGRDDALLMVELAKWAAMIGVPEARTSARPGFFTSRKRDFT